MEARVTTISSGKKRRRPSPEQVTLSDDQIVAEKWNAKHQSC
jgi:hypothetical protein